MQIGDIIEAIRSGRVRVTHHAHEEAEADRVTLDAVYASVLNGEIIEDYPTDRPYPRCLVFGRTSRGEPVHSVWAYNEENRWAVVVTVYRPDPSLWVDWRQRRR